MCFFSLLFSVMLFFSKQIFVWGIPQKPSATKRENKSYGAKKKNSKTLKEMWRMKVANRFIIANFVVCVRPELTTKSVKPTECFSCHCVLAFLCIPFGWTTHSTRTRGTFRSASFSPFFLIQYFIYPLRWCYRWPLLPSAGGYMQAPRQWRIIQQGQRKKKHCDLYSHSSQRLIRELRRI